MPISEQPLVERIARVLAGAELSANAEGSDSSAGDAVDRTWRDHITQALAVLHTMREADSEMARVGDPDGWTRMVEKAIEQVERSQRASA